MTEFNINVPLTQEWKDTILASIENRRKNPVVSAADCEACNKSKGPSDNYIQCTKCPIGHPTDNGEGWCARYVRGMGSTIKSRFKNETERLAYLDKIKQAVLRKNVIK